MSFNKHYTNFRKADKMAQEEAEQPLTAAEMDPYSVADVSSFTNPSSRRGGGKPSFIGQATKAPVISKYKEYNLPVANAKLLVSLLNVSIQTKQPMIVYGDAGVGKSDIIRQTAKASTPADRKFVMWKDIVSDIDAFLNGPAVKKSYVLFDMRASEYLPEDIRGIPDINSAVDFLRYKSPAWVKWCTHPDAAGILFFDELNRGITPTLNSLLQITLDRVIVERPVAPGVAMIAAANLGSEFNGTSELDPALRNRFSQGAYVADPESWIEWALKSGVHQDVIDFVKVNASNKEFNVFYQVPTGPEDQAFVSPRALVLFSNAYKKIHEMYDQQVESGEEPDANYFLQLTEQYAGQYCGIAWGTAFAEHVHNMALFDLDDLAYKTQSQNIGEIAKDPKSGKVSVATINTYVNFIARAILYNFRNDVRYTVEGLKNIISMSKILPKFEKEGIGQIASIINQAHPGGVYNSRVIAPGVTFIMQFLLDEKKRYQSLLSASSQLKVGNDAQIEAFLKAVYANAGMDKDEFKHVEEQFKSLLAKGKGDGQQAFENVNAMTPGVLTTESCDSLLDTFKKLAGAAKIQQARGKK